MAVLNDDVPLVHADPGAVGVLPGEGDHGFLLFYFLSPDASVRMLAFAAAPFPHAAKVEDVEVALFIVHLDKIFAILVRFL